MPVKHTKIWKFFSSIKLAIWLLVVIALLSLIGTLIPQNETSEFYTAKFGQYGYQFLSKTSLNNIYASFWFLLLLILLALNLSVCLLNRFFPKSRSLGSFISHLSILVILLGALIGMFYGQKGYIKINKGQEINFFATENKQVALGFSLRLDDFIYNENIDSKEKLLVYPIPKGAVCSIHDSKGKDTAQNFIAAIPTEIGSEAVIADTGYKVKVLRYIPDFVMDTASKKVVSRSARPNNPALELELKDKDGVSKKVWAFAHFPDMHQDAGFGFKFVYKWAPRRPKDFISKVSVIKDAKIVISKDIRVNEPLRFSGYSFFQTSYDLEDLNWSGLKAVRDPGVPVVYLGFLMLIIGLVLIFYIEPLKRRG